MRRSRLSVCALILCISTLVGVAEAQEPASDVRRAQASRSELQALAADRELTTPSEAEALRQRLAEGDFQAGDRIVLQVAGESTLTDTFTVRTGRVLALPNLPEMSLKGVLRSELDGYLTKQIGQYIRNPDVDATSLIRVAVLGGVTRPGFYNLPAEMLVSDAVMSAGGPVANADVRKTVVRRGQVEVVSRKRVQDAYARGVSLDQLNLHGGDEIVVGQRSGGTMGALQTAGLISGILFGVAAAASLF
jgi:protein involved in polysaccharide export with SLBB domain